MDAQKGFFNGHFYKLVTVGKGETTIEIDGVRMHQTKNKTPLQDAKDKARLLGLRKGAVVLDVCTGLGYSTIACLHAGAGKVITIEKDENVLEIARQNPKFYLANYQKYNHRITWPSCSLFSGQATITYLCKGTCGKEYTIARTGHDSRKFTGYCQSCAEISHREKRELAREMAEKMLPRYERRDDRGNEGAGKKVGEKNGGDVKVCFPVKAKEGTKRHKCLGNSIAEECPSYSACINYACNMGWSGFRDCGEEGKGRR